LIVVPVVYAIFDSIRVRLGKDKKVDYAELMTAEYKHRKLVDGFNPKHKL
jgi:HAE1 family hydrophobic/amphiphilic exporter-1